MEIIINSIRYDVIDNIRDHVWNKNFALRVELFNDKYCLPIVSATNSLNVNYPHISYDGQLAFIRLCENKDILDASGYHASNIIDFDSVDNIKDYIKNCKTLISAENVLLTNIDNITQFPVNETDDLPLAFLKESINAKNCDINMYSNRFSNNSFSNDYRHLRNDNKISLKKIMSICDALNIKVSLYFEDDDSKTIINPMGKTIGGYLN